MTKLIVSQLVKKFAPIMEFDA